MFASTKKLFLTLVVSLVLILALSPVSEAKDFQAVRRGHGSLKRIVRKRSPIPQDGGILGLGGNREAGDAEASASSSGLSAPASVSASSTALSVPSAPLSSTSATSSASSTSVPSASSSAPPSSSSSTTSATSIGPSTTPTSTSTRTTAPPSTPTTASEAAPTEGPGEVTSTVTGARRTETATAANAAQTGEADPNTRSGATSSKGKEAALTVLIVVAASVGAVVIIWTIFRKWKLARSSKFDQRLQPIDWQPTDQHDGIIPAHRRTTSDTSSFHSGLGHGGYGATSDHGHGSSNHGHGRLSPLPDHDFTAGSSNLAPVGGYADLARGPSLTRGSSPSPSMAELSRGPSLTRPTYDVGVPLHHQSPYGARY
ncbi:hypothetical protein Moror_472 [Moniliophthora roreri MCA 2997]|uniref:Uncharacterized protein n=1 Tax=Moniliophthora roreri (strain MCA 2997) TaxID=1381753 RepID=V2XYU1_MONRO|nr:hypothetical protein Moror_472 [Moniliophthora roreri MCA 2997]